MKILGYNYALVTDTDMEALGSMHSRSQRLKLATDMHPDQQLSTLLHEIIEALNYHLDLGIQHQTIMALEAGLYQVLADNGVDLSPLMGK